MNFQKQFISEYFLETDSISTLNRIAVAAAGVINENCEILDLICTNLERDEACRNSEQPQKSNRSLLLDGGKSFYTDVILNYTDKEYEKKFKMKCSTSQKIINYLANTYPGIPNLSKKFHIFIWILTNDNSFEDIATLFGVNKSTVSYILHEMSSLVAELKDQFIKWPTEDEQNLTRIRVSARLKFPNCIGFIDASRLKVGSKRNKKYPPDIVLLQAVCDETLKFTNIHVGVLGETRKAKVFKDSPLSSQLKNKVNFENHILGDSSYKLKRNLMTPFYDKELLTSEEIRYNDLHWKTRAYIGSAFSRLKNRFTKINHIDLTKRESIESIIISACILHNLILQNEPDKEIIKTEIVGRGEGVTIDTDIVTNSSEKRQFLCNYINYMENSINDEVERVEEET